MDRTVERSNSGTCRNLQLILDSDRAIDTTVAVIIPYFQKKTGILRRALSSVLEQRLSPNTAIQIVVVDDGSPVPARTEVDGLNLPSNFRLQLIEQPNGGVAAARNTGLRQVSEDTTYIAFIDSDDIWNPEHLSIALSALNAGYDYYFCNTLRIGSQDSYFSVVNFNPHISSSCAIGDDVYEINKKFLFEFALRTHVSQAPTVVYRRLVAHDVTFYEPLRTAGEDMLFLLQVIWRCQRVCFSPAPHVTLGDGVNIWHNRFSWDAPEHRASQLQCLIGSQEIKKSFTLSPENKQYIDSNISCFRNFFAYLMVRWFLKTGQLGSKGIYDMSRNDPWFWLWYPLCILHVAICFPLGLYTPPDE